MGRGVLLSPMPGIVGIIGGPPTGGSQRLVNSMLAAMWHEPFYRSGIFSAPSVGVNAGWSTHAEGRASNPVFLNEDRTIALVLAGECFPGDGTVERLRQRGHRVGKAAGDWLVHSYEELGDNFFASLNGLFSGVLIDQRTGAVHLFNDRYGVERLYVHRAGEALYFASEAKAILAVAPECRAFDSEGVSQHVAYGCTIADRSLFRKIELLPGGSRWTFRHGAWSQHRYFSPTEWEQQDRLPGAEFARELGQLLFRIVPRHTDSDNTIGMSLTAGLDTRMIMACLPAWRDRLVAFTYSGEDVEPQDVRIGRNIARACGLEYRAFAIEPEFFREFPQWVDRTVAATDGCFGLCGAHEMYFSRRVRAISTVRLTGNYGSEILRGVTTFKPNLRVVDVVAREFRPRVLDAVRHPAVQTGHPVTFAAFKETPWNLFGNLAASRSVLGFRTPYLDNEFVRLAYRCPAGEQPAREACMAVVREQSPELAQIATDMGYLGSGSWVAGQVRHAWEAATFKLDYINNEGFPDALAPLEPAVQFGLRQLGLLGRHKHLHYRTWFRTRLRDYIADSLATAATHQSSLWDQAAVKRIAADHLAGRRNHVGELDAILTLQAVEQTLLRSTDCAHKPHTAATSALNAGDLALSR